VNYGLYFFEKYGVVLIQMKRQNHFKIDKRHGLTYALLFSIFWAVNIILVKIGLLEGVHPLVFIFIMFATAALLSIFYNLVFNRDEFKKINKSNIWKMILVGVIGSGMANIFTFYGLKLSTAINYGFIIKTGLIFVIALSYFFLKERITPQKIFLALLLLAGAYLISTKGESYIPHIGDILIVGGAFFYSVSTIIAKPLLRAVKPETLVMFRTAFASLFILPFVPFIATRTFNLKTLLIVILAGFIAFLSLTFLNKTLQNATASYVSMMSMITPLLVAIMAFAILGEGMNMHQLIGGVLIISSAMLIQKTDIYLR
jgi:drug/metabolite transporter (DMT)-like permease